MEERGYEQKTEKNVDPDHCGMCADRSAVISSCRRISGICTLYDPLCGDRL